MAGAIIQQAQAPVVRRGRPLALAHLFWRDRYACASALFLVVLVASALAAPALTSFNPAAQDLLGRLSPPAWLAGGSWQHPLGTDALGRDLFSRIIYGARVSLRIGLIVTLLAGATGSLLGLLAGYRGGFVDTIVMRLIDVQTAFPYLLLAITIMAVVGPGERNLVAVLAAGQWIVFARFTRAAMLVMRTSPLVEAVRAIGATDARIMLRHALPNLASTLVTLATLELSRIILSEAGLSFLGLGVQPPTPAWGLMIAEGHSYLTSAWWLSAWPGVMVAVTALSINLFATWLRAATDPVQLSRLASLNLKGAGL